MKWTWPISTADVSGAVAAAAAKLSSCYFFLSPSSTFSFSRDIIHPVLSFKTEFTAGTLFLTHECVTDFLVSSRLTCPRRIHVARCKQPHCLRETNLQSTNPRGKKGRI
jgi:hypothetical protein